MSVDPASSNDVTGDGYHRRRRLEDLDSEAVRNLVLSMPAIEQAKGVLMGCYGIDANSAFTVLTQVSSAKNLKVRDLAAAVVEAITDGPADASPCERVRRAMSDSPLG